MVRQTKLLSGCANIMIKEVGAYKCCDSFFNTELIKKKKGEKRVVMNNVNSYYSLLSNSSFPGKINSTSDSSIKET